MNQAAAPPPITSTATTTPMMMMSIFLLLAGAAAGVLADTLRIPCGGRRAGPAQSMGEQNRMAHYWAGLQPIIARIKAQNHGIHCAMDSARKHRNGVR